MLIRKKITALIFSFASVIFLLPTLVLAQVEQDFGTDTLSGIATASTRDLFEMVTGIINTVLYFLGAITILLFLYAGWLWFTSQGNKDKIEKAKKIMLSAIIGLAIIFSSYAVVNWIFKDAIQRAFYDITNPRDPRSGGGGVGIGGGVIESHYPESNAKNIPRNTNIYITFKEAMDIDTIATGCNTSGTTVTCDINTGNILLRKSGTTDNISNIEVTYDTTDPLVFEFNPYGNGTSEADLLGEQTKDTKYQMLLMNLTTDSGRRAFGLGSYSWSFTVSTFSDRTAPYVVSVRPEDSTAPRNAIVQINFSEAVNPTLASGSNIAPSTFNNITLTYDTGTAAIGRYVSSNQYRTVEFIPNELCGQNSCGLNVFCLPGGKVFTGNVKTTIKDMAGNALSPEETWNFSTSDNIDTDPPIMTKMEPTGDAVGLSDPVKMTFNKPLLSRSINSTNIHLFKNTNESINYWFALGNSSDQLKNNVINIRHERFDVNTSYLATSTSAIMDSNQNCWNPCRCEGATCDCETAGACGLTPEGVPYCQTQ